MNPELPLGAINRILKYPPRMVRRKRNRQYDPLMPLNLHWIGEKDYDRLAAVRVQCYAPSMSAVEKYRGSIEKDPRAKAGDFLIAQRDGLDVGTSTSLSRCAIRKSPALARGS